MSFKENVYHQCAAIIQNKISLLQKQLHDLTDSAGNETKRTAGDKHETALAMLQIEQENNSRQLQDALQQKAILEKIDPSLQTLQAVRGSIITTNKGIFFLSLGLGKITIEEKTVIALSPESPLGNLLLHTKTGDTCTFNNIVYTIEQID
jgi:hypothetical protein